MVAPPPSTHGRVRNSAAAWSNAPTLFARARAAGGDRSPERPAQPPATLHVGRHFSLSLPQALVREAASPAVLPGTA
ncbi:hypothetical protein ACIRRH_08900 [Kitasatospora sp. NPDC101235]|uniref:hypothetical protein n=1 Tax=Kitasatospora sp. NPDC101235 TaxID=3364101 RepID=UPI0038114E03